MATNCVVAQRARATGGVLDGGERRAERGAAIEPTVGPAEVGDDHEREAVRVVGVRLEAEQGSVEGVQPGGHRDVGVEVAHAYPRTRHLAVRILERRLAVSAG